MKNVEALKDLYVALGGEAADVADANTSVEVLNAIAALYDGETDATINPVAIENIAAVVTGGGGGGGASELADFTVRNTSDDPAMVTNYFITEDNKVSIYSETVPSYSGVKQLKMPFDYSDNIASGMIVIGFVSAQVARGKGVSIENGTIVQQSGLNDGNGWMLKIEQNWSPSEAPIITIQNADV